MLQSEFYERTGVTLSADEYAKVEHIYLSVEMDKDEFCKLWLENRDNKVISELMETISKFENEKKKFLKDYEDTVNEIEKRRKEYDEDLENERRRAQDKLESLAIRLIPNLDDETRAYDILEEEFGLDFICKVKLENNIDLESHEREHLVKKL